MAVTAAPRIESWPGGSCERQRPQRDLPDSRRYRRKPEGEGAVGRGRGGCARRPRRRAVVCVAVRRRRAQACGSSAWSATAVRRRSPARVRVGTTTGWRVCVRRRRSRSGVRGEPELADRTCTSDRLGRFAARPRRELANGRRPSFADVAVTCRSRPDCRTRRSRPRYPTSCRAPANRWVSPIAAVNVTAVITLTPGRLISRRTSAEASASGAIVASTAPTSQSRKSMWRRHAATVSRSSTGRSRPSSQPRPVTPNPSLIRWTDLDGGSTPREPRSSRGSAP